MEMFSDHAPLTPLLPIYSQQRSDRTSKENVCFDLVTHPLDLSTKTIYQLMTRRKTDPRQTIQLHSRRPEQQSHPTDTPETPELEIYALEPALALLRPDDLEEPVPEEEFLEVYAEQETPGGGQAVVGDVEQGYVEGRPELVGFHGPEMIESSED